MLCVGFDLLHVSVGQSGCWRSGVVVGQSGIEGGEAFTVNASCLCVRGGKQSGAGTEIRARVKQLFGREMQKGGVFAVDLEQPDADGYALREKPFRPRKRFFERCGLSFKSDGAAIPALAAGKLMGTVNTEGVRVERGLGACDGFEGTDGDVRRAGLRERSEVGTGNLGVGVGRGCLRKRSGSGGGEKRCENDLCKAHQKLVAPSTGIWKSRAQLMALDC
jgi:hypothetical protein